MSGRWTILACGEAARGDDAVGIAAVDRLDPARLDGVCVRRIAQLLPDDVVLALEDGPCLVVDAVRGIEPGRIVELPLRAVAATDGPLPASSHALPVEIVIGVAEALGADIDNGAFIGIGASSFGLGGRLSFAAWSGARTAAEMIARRIEAEEVATCV